MDDLIHDLTTTLAAIKPLHPLAFDVLDNSNASTIDTVRAVVEMRDVANATRKLLTSVQDISPVAGNGEDIEAFCL